MYQRRRNGIQGCESKGGGGGSKIRKSCPILENNSALDSSHRVVCFRIGSFRGLGGTPLSCKGQKHILQYFSGVNNFCNLDCKRQLVTTVPPVPTNNNFTTLPETLQRFLNRCRVGLLKSGFNLRKDPSFKIPPVLSLPSPLRFSNLQYPWSSIQK